MEKHEVINEIIWLYDAVKDLSDKNSKLMNSNLNRIDLRVLEEGKKTILEQCVLSTKSIKDKKKGTIPTFEEWRKGYVWRTPEWMSRNDFNSYFDKDLHKIYDSELAKLEGDLNE